MNILLLCGFLAFMPFLLGQGVLALTDEFTHHRSTLSTRYITGLLLMILSAAPVNIYGVLKDAPLSKLIWFWGVLLLGFGTLCYLATVVQKIMSFRKCSAAPLAADAEKSLPSTAVLILYGVAGLLILAQFLYVVLSGHITLTHDIMPETVNSFLQTEGLYRINPLTGSPYESGIPNRLKLMCLPTFYAMLCRVFHQPVDTVVCHMVPAYYLLCGYVAYHLLSKALFPGKEPAMALRRALFLALVAVLVFATDSGFGLDGFDLLHAGYRETTLRAWILMPALIAFLPERRWGLCLLILAVEAMTIWTLFGTGSCLVIAVGILLCRRYLTAKDSKTAEAKEVTGS